MTLTITPLREIPLVKSGDDLGELVLQALDREGIRLQDGDIVVLAQKIVSKAENRLVYLPDIEPSRKAVALGEQTGKDPRLVEVILRESSEVLRQKTGTIIVEHRLGFVCASAGVDHSNVQPGSEGLAEDWVLMLPENPDASAEKLRRKLEDAAGVRLGVLIIDSHGRSWRLGTVGVAIGLSGMPGVVDLRGTPDLFGFRLRITEVGAADELAAASSLMMGQASEGTPVVHVRGFPYPLREGALQELIRPKEQDLFR